MPVNLKLIQEPAIKPRPPVWWVWLLLLVVMLLGGMADAILSNMSRTEINSEAFWISALGLPSLYWLILLALRVTWYKGQLATAQGKDKERDRQLRREIQRGQRYLNVFVVSLHSALRESEDADGNKQWEALQGRTKAFKTQPSWKSHEGVRHSRLPLANGESADQLLSRGLRKTLEELSSVLSSLPHETPVSLLLEINSSLPDSLVEKILQESLAASEIRQCVTRIEGGGLSAVDRWLDDSRNEHSLLMIIAVQLIPDQTEGSAESVVGLLLGGIPASPELIPLARLHRPEMMHHTDAHDFQYALKQSMDWVPVAADKVKNGFLVGVNPAWHMAIASGLQAIQSPVNAGQDLHDLGNTLGYPGPAAPWVAITCAVESCLRSDSQLIVSGDNRENTPLWVTMVTPAQK
uniref:hypothetical protein n=1 Tax=Klebsiella sp. TaxID=576 RepID=UPI0031DE106C